MTPDPATSARYDIRHSYDWNYAHAPDSPVKDPHPSGRRWSFLRWNVSAPIAVAAGPLLNGRWIAYYAQRGFDVLTYKTVRSQPRAAYGLPNLLPVENSMLDERGTEIDASAAMQGSWAVSFGMPSQAPEVWRADVAQTRRELAAHQVLAVSVVASPTAESTPEEISQDYARCAQWAVESGADVVEANFSCPNVASGEGFIDQQPDLSAQVAGRIRAAIGDTPLLLKIGHLADDSQCDRFLAAVAPYAQGLVSVNCLSRRVRGAGGQWHFAGQPRGIAGHAIRDASVAQIARLKASCDRRQFPLELIGCGGVFTAEHVRQYLNAGARSVQLATAVMLDPRVGLQLREQLSAGESSPPAAAEQGGG